MRPGLFALALLSACGFTAAPAAAQNYPWCAHYDVGDEAVNCGFVTYAQCMATVSGIGGFCMANNDYRPSTPRPSPHARHQVAHKPS